MTTAPDRNQRGLVRAFLSGVIGEDPSREGLRETPERVVKAWAFEWGWGYTQDPARVLKTFEDGAAKYDEMIIVSGLPVYSHCTIASTFIETPRGRLPIQDLKHGDWIYTVEPSTMELSLVRCQHPRITQRKAQLVRVITDNDTIICTPEHRFLSTEGEWIEAKDLRNGIRLCSLYKGTMRAGKGDLYYPTLLAGRWTRHADGLTIKGPSSDGHIAEHRFVAYQTGQELAGTRMSIVHHEDEQIWNNEPENLHTVSVSEHNRLHQRTQKLAHNAVRKAAAALASGRKEVREKRSASVKKSWELRRNHIVLGVDAVERREDVWCMTVPKTHTFFANGIASHNCEHHIAPFWGEAHIGYIPDGRIVGLSKLGHLVNIYARRLQVQERLTTQIVDALEEHLKPRGCGVIIKCRHLCMESRGLRAPGTITITSALRGVMLTNESARAEFLSLKSRATGPL